MNEDLNYNYISIELRESIKELQTLLDMSENKALTSSGLKIGLFTIFRYLSRSYNYRNPDSHAEIDAEVASQIPEDIRKLLEKNKPQW